MGTTFSILCHQTLIYGNTDNPVIFQVKLLSGSNNLLATWTAPGGDFDEGSVASYRFVYSEDIADLLKPDRRPKILLAFDRMENAGTDSSYDFEFPHYDTDYYVAAYGFDIAGNKGKISNLVHVRVPSPPKTYNPVYGEDGSSSSSPIFSLSGGTNSDLDWIMIGVIAGVVGVLLVLSIVAISYYFVAARNGAARRRAAVSTHQGQAAAAAAAAKKGVILTGTAGAAAPGSGSGSSTDETDSSSFDSDIKNIMLSNPPLGPTLSAGVTTAASSLPPHMAQLQKHHHLHQQQHQQSSADSGVSSNGSHGEPTPTNGDQQNVTPVYWSASQLLSKLDHTTLPGNYSPYVTTVSGSGDPFGHSYHHVQPGPHSLQMYAAATATGAAGGSYSTSSGIPSEWPAFHQIPEEFTITVGNLSHSAAAIGDGEASRKVPPPVMPKPRNITQV